MLHPHRGVDAVVAEAQRADAQGFDSMWLGDHLTYPAAEARPNGPLDTFTLMTALGAVTSRIRLAWSTLNPAFRRPVVTAKMLASLDQITKGRVIFSFGAGWNKAEYEAYDVPFIEDHDQRILYAREVARLFKQAWTHPAPDVIDFDGQFIKTRGLAFNPAPYQSPHPPIWVGGESDLTLETVREIGDGWVLLTAGGLDRIREMTSRADWPKRPMDVVKNVRIHVAETRDAAIAEAKIVFDHGGRYFPKTLDEFVAKEAVGTVEDCLRHIETMRGVGVNYLRVEFLNDAHQDQAARLLLPALAELT